MKTLLKIPIKSYLRTQRNIENLINTIQEKELKFLNLSEKRIIKNLNMFHPLEQRRGVNIW